MENQVTLDRSEYDSLQDYKRKFTQQKELMENDEPLILLIKHDYHGEERLKVYSGEPRVKELFLHYESRVKEQEKNLKNIEDRYKEESNQFKEIKQILNK